MIQVPDKKIFGWVGNERVHRNLGVGGRSAARQRSLSELAQCEYIFRISGSKL